MRGEKFDYYYDGYCSMCQTSSTLWERIDRRHRLTFTSFHTLKNHPAVMEKELHVHGNGKWFIGFKF